MQIITLAVYNSLGLSDPRNAREAMAAPDADGWRDTMDQIWSLITSINSFRTRLVLRTLRLGWVLHRQFENGVFEKYMARLVARGNYQCSLTHRTYLHDNSVPSFPGP